MRARPVVLATAGLASALILTSCGQAGHGGVDAASHATSPAVATAAASDAGLHSNTAAGIAADVAFAQLMIPHHQQAVAMADLALAQATTQPVKELAAQIKAAQAPEIEQLRSWLTAWGAPLEMEGAATSSAGGHDMGTMDMSGHDMGGMSMSGMMSDEDMRSLADAVGGEFDRRWLDMMIVHHEGAVEMAKQIRTASENRDVRLLADAIIAGQSAEIATMRQLVAS